MIEKVAKKLPMKKWKIYLEKNNLLISFIEAIKEIAVDCELFQSHNMMSSKYKCFKFNEETLLKTVVLDIKKI